MQKAILFISWNRLDYTKQTFEAIKNIKPKRLYLASDGPRKSNPCDTESIEEVRNYIINNIDWDCDVKTKFEKENLGCQKNISQAITWFFEHEEDGIILEDDCVPSESFFKYCEELLDKYKDDKRIWHITGYSAFDDKKGKDTYWFGRVMMCWGWASWRDRWQHFKFDMSKYDKNNLKKFSKRNEVQNFWREMLYRLNTNTLNSWAYRWLFEIVSHDGLCINPYKNLITNIGVDGLHCKCKNPLCETQRYELDEIIHPKKFEFNEKMTDELYRKFFNIKRKPFSWLIRKEKHENKKMMVFMNLIRINYKTLPEVNAG